MPLHYEDIAADFAVTLGPRPLTLDDSLRFCGEFDRLPIHLDAEAAAGSIYGGLIASGLHTLSLSAALVVDGFLRDTTMTGASGMSEVRWFAPVRPPAQISVRLSVLEKIGPKPGRDFGTIRMQLEAFSGGEQKVMSAVVAYLFRCRTSPAG